MRIELPRIEMLGVMFQDDLDRCAAALSVARRAHSAGDVDLHWIGSMQDAREVQDAAFDYLGGTPVGYTIAATTDTTSRLLNCSEPIVGRLIEDYVYDSGSTIRLPYGTIGVGAQFVFVIGAPVRWPVNLRSVSDSIISCRMGLQVLGRRAASDVPLNDRSATADFALDIACVLGGSIEDWDQVSLEAVEVSLRIGGNELATGHGTEIFGHPIRAVVALAQSLQARGVSLQAGDTIATGSCTGLTQVVPGQAVEAVFHRCGGIHAYFV